MKNKLRALRKKVEAIRFNRTVVKALKLPKITQVNQDEIVIVTLAYHAALHMTVLALKSFLAHFPYGRIELIDDGSLTEPDYDILLKQFDNLKIVHVKDIDTGNCPKGNCWERLVHIINLSQDNYVLQVDTDTLTIGPIPEVFENFKRNRSFTLGGGAMWQEMTELEYMSDLAKSWRNSHVQSLSESNLDRLQKIEISRYARGCAAFAGFARGQLNASKLEELTAEMEELIGKEKWSEWGSEQFASNVMVSLCQGSSVLPWPKYQNFGYPFMDNPKLLASYEGRVALMHFIGPHRHDLSVYKKLAARFISKK